MSRAVLGLAVALFAGWLGWLGSHAAGHGNPPVVSRAQLLAADADVLARIDAGGGVAVERVLWPVGANEPAGDLPLAVTDARHFAGPGLYLVPLRKSSRGFDIVQVAAAPKLPAGPAVYPWTPAVEAQWRSSRGGP